MVVIPEGWSLGQTVWLGSGRAVQRVFDGNGFRMNTLFPYRGHTDLFHFG